MPSRWAVWAWAGVAAGPRPPADHGTIQDEQTASAVCQVIRLWVPSWCYGPAVSHRRTQRSPPSCSAPARAGLPVLDDIEPAPLRPCLRARRSDRPDRSAKPAGREALTAAPAPAATPVTDRLQAVKVPAGPREGAGSVSRSGEVDRDRVGGVAVQAVPGVVVAAGGAGVLMSGVVLHVAQGRARRARDEVVTMFLSAWPPSPKRGTAKISPVDLIRCSRRPDRRSRTSTFVTAEGLVTEGAGCSLQPLTRPFGPKASGSLNRRASVQLNIRLEPAEAALIKRVIPKGTLRDVTASLLVDYASQLEAQMPKLTEEGSAAA